ncbi:hypothetical protein KY290_031772 [Solanum tuberosum]|uniref:Uncharacterized protein n=1 Tax=Solanum tuberosum TaxID=4113 RepID=A0ABQ7UBY5_SOLTU|nr:hypothetical protein KY285_031030 [Solanum tuberosum]KAH0743779.1 hypothetical protein KY290_031772 [Solanum tuberosum]
MLSDIDGYSGSSSNALGVTSSKPTGAYVQQSRSSQISHPNAPHFTPDKTSGTALSASMVNPSNQWIVDTGSTNHMAKDLFSGRVKGTGKHVQGLHAVNSPCLNAGHDKP